MNEKQPCCAKCICKYGGMPMGCIKPECSCHNQSEKKCEHDWEPCPAGICTSDLHTHHCFKCGEHSFKPSNPTPVMEKKCGYPLHPRLGMTCGESKPCKGHEGWEKTWPVVGQPTPASEKQLREKLENYECSGRYCQHETSDKHYTLLFGDIQTLVTAAREEERQRVEKVIESLRRKRNLENWSAGQEVENYGHNAALDEALALINTKE